MRNRHFLIREKIRKKGLNWKTVGIYFKLMHIYAVSIKYLFHKNICTDYFEYRYYFFHAFGFYKEENKKESDKA